MHTVIGGPIFGKDGSCVGLQDAQALLDLKAAMTTSPAALNLSTWAGTDPCTPTPWAQITCTAGRVSLIMLGEIPLGASHDQVRMQTSPQDMLYCQSHTHAVIA
jgi:hypothetical protein